MRAFKLPKPGTKYGPCVPGCSHVDCQITREDAASTCHWCGKGMGYDVWIFATKEGYVHADCEEKNEKRE